MAALLALRTHQKHPSITPRPPSDTEQRLERGRAYLEGALKRWDVSSAVHVGFEILVPSLLRKLEDEGFAFAFDGRSALMRLNARKTAKLTAADFKQRTTLTHSLEAFVGTVDLGQLSHLLSNGSMMGSPAATAAYLINRTGWDAEAEAYLRLVVKANCGRVPSAFPISSFEVSWVLSTLLAAGYTPADLGPDNVLRLADFLRAQLEDQSGATGFDADDKAKSIYSLRLLGQPASCESMLAAFESPRHFKTYHIESSESFSTDCNVLLALLAVEVPGRHITQISKALDFLFEAWVSGKSSDKWNVELQYSMMLFAEALVRVLEAWDAGGLKGLSIELLRNQLPLATVQMAIRTLSAQAENGSWNSSPEITAYALLTLKSLAALPWVAASFEGRIEAGMTQATEFLQRNEGLWTKPEKNWVEKVAYGFSILSEAYCLAALKAAPSSCAWSDAVTGLCDKPHAGVSKFCGFFSRLPLFKDEPAWRLRASIAEGNMYGPYLRRIMNELDIFPQHAAGKYLAYIPATWTLCNNSRDFGLTAEVLFDMMVLSVLNFQVDKWLEDVTSSDKLSGNFEALRLAVNRVLPNVNLDDGAETAENGTNRFKSDRDAMPDGFRESQKLSNGEHHDMVSKHDVAPNGNGIRGVVSGGNDDAFRLQVETILSRFRNYIVDKTSRAPKSARSRVYQELSIFILAQITHGEDNSRMPKPSESEKSGQQLRVFDYGRKTYFDWVRTTSADHSSCPYSFEFFRCLVSSAGSRAGSDCFPNVMARYLAQDVCRHLATMARQHNDYGSLARDLAENNLNSVNFADFHLAEEVEVETAKRDLLEIADYEYACVGSCLSRLQHVVSVPTWKAVNIFVDVAHLYGQIYIVKDINDS
ncbi:hypothetical protein CDD83_6841 [Cordyceps sp. RAO-2017]|nr:hypothetical protein CDD83_6841 [Cordyceps sp. RAO-2017]